MGDGNSWLPIILVVMAIVILIIVWAIVVPRKMFAKCPPPETDCHVPCHFQPPPNQQPECPPCPPVPKLYENSIISPSLTGSQESIFIVKLPELEMSKTLDVELEVPEFGLLADGISINTAVVDPVLERIYIHVLNPDISGVYYYDNGALGEEGASWQYLVSTAGGCENSIDEAFSQPPKAKYNIPKFDTTISNTIHSIYLSGSEIYLVTLEGCYKIDGTPIDELPGLVDRIDPLAVTSTGRIFEGMTEIEFPQGTSIPEYGPYQIDRVKTDNFAYYCNKNGIEGLSFFGSEGSKFLPGQMVAFGAKDDSVVYVDPSGGIYFHSLEGEGHGLLDEVDIDNCYVKVRMGGKYCYIIITSML